MPRPRPTSLALAAALVVAPVVLAAPAGAAVSPFASCADVADATPGAPDGEYALTVDGRTFDVYCADLASSPVEYLTLPSGGATNVGQAVADWQNSIGTTITTRYTRLRLTLPTAAGAPVTVDATDRRFATSTGMIGASTSADWATGSACNYPWGSLQYGEGSADLRGTPFGVDAASFTVGGWAQDGTITQLGPQRVATRGNGWCGGAGPTTPTVVPLTWVAPEVTTAPADAAVASGADATFTVAASSPLPLTVRWEVSDDAGATWQTVAGATGTTLTLPAVTTAQDGRRVRAVLSGTGGTVTTDAATLAVAPAAPAVTTQPTDVAVTSGGDAVFTVVATGDPAPAVRWQTAAAGADTWTDVADATSPVLTVPAVTTAQDGRRYRAVLTNVAGTVTSAAATLDVGPGAPVVTSGPADVAVASGGDAVFTVVPGGDPAPGVRWQLSADGGATWSDLDGENGTTLVLTELTTDADGVLVRAVLTSAGGTVETAPATLSVAPALPTVGAPAGVRVDAGGRAVFSVDVTGDPEPTVQWQRSSDDGATWQDVAGAVADVLELDGVTSADDGVLVRAVATNAAGSVVSASARLDVVPAPAPSATPTPTASATPTPAPSATAAPAGDAAGALATTGAAGPWLALLAGALVLVVAGTALAARAARVG